MVPLVAWAALAFAVVLGVLLARAGVRIADRYRDGTGRVSVPRAAGVSGLLVLLLAGATALTGARPALLAVAWAAGAGLVLAQVDLAVHRLPDRVLAPAVAVVTTAYLVDAVALGSWGALLRAVLAGLLCLAVSAAAAAARHGPGFGDVKLLGLVGLVLGWFGWAVLGLGVLVGLVLGALGSVVLVALGRAGWRTTVPVGPPLLLGAALALALTGPVPGA